MFNYYIMNQTVNTGGANGQSYHSHSVPIATIDTGGALSTTEQQIAGLKNFVDGIGLGDLADIEIGGLTGNKVIMSNSSGTSLIESFEVDIDATPETFAFRDLNGDSKFNKLDILTTINFNSLTPGLFLALDLSGNVISTSGGSSVILAPIGAAPNVNGATLTGPTLNLEPASATFGGVLTALAQSIGGLKSFPGGINLPSLTPSQSLALDGTGNIISVPSSAITLAPVGATPNNNAATLTGTILNLEPASVTFPGVVTIGQQEFAGVKILNNQLFVNNILFVDGTGGPAGTYRFSASSTDPLGRKQVWHWGSNSLDPNNGSGLYDGTGAILRLGSSGFIGDSVNSIAEGIEIYGMPNAGGAMNASNLDYTTIKASSIIIREVVGSAGNILFNVSPTILNWRSAGSIYNTLSVTNSATTILNSDLFVSDDTSLGALLHINDSSVSSFGASLVLENGGVPNFYIRRSESGSKETEFINTSAAGTSGDIIFYPNILVAGLRLRNVDGGVTIPSNIPSTNCITGSLVVVGGVGINGDLNVCGTVNSSTFYTENRSTAPQTIPDITDTLVQFDTITSSNNFPAPTNSNTRFTPTKAGYYNVNSCIQFEANATGSVRAIWIQVNSDPTLQYGRSQVTSASVSRIGVASSFPIFFNGTTDYFEVFVNQDSGGSLDIGNLTAPAATSRVSAHWMHA